MRRPVAVSMPIIGSLNGTTSGGGVRYARLIEEVYACERAIELRQYGTRSQRLCRAPGAPPTRPPLPGIDLPGKRFKLPVLAVLPPTASLVRRAPAAPLRAVEALPLIVHELADSFFYGGRDVADVDLGGRWGGPPDGCHARSALHENDARRGNCAELGD